MPRNKKLLRPPTEGAYTVAEPDPLARPSSYPLPPTFCDTYGKIGLSDGRPSKDALVDELVVRFTPLDQLDSNRLKHICETFGIPGTGKKEDYLTRLDNLLKRRDAPKVPDTITFLKPIAADKDGLNHTKDKLERFASSTSKDKMAATSGDAEAASLRDQVKVGQKRKQDGNVSQSDLGKKIKQAEEFTEPKARADAPANEFSIKMCVSVLNAMKELSSEEKVESFEVFKDAQDREIFLCAEPAERLLWLRRKIQK